MADFLSYVNSGRANSKFTQALDAETKRVKNDTDWRERYVTWEMDLKIMCKNAERKGEQKGLEKGAKKGRIDTARALKKQGKLSDSEIAEATALPLREVSAL